MTLCIASTRLQDYFSTQTGYTYGSYCHVSYCHALQASEDDAIKTRTHIPLPVDSFSKRLDSLVVVSQSVACSPIAALRMQSCNLRLVRCAWSTRLGRLN